MEKASAEIFEGKKNPDFGHMVFGHLLYAIYIISVPLLRHLKTFAWGLNGTQICKGFFTWA